MHLDVARNFQSVDSLKLLLDQMAAYKLNKLHLHLSDDEGWRLEIESLPELTTIGSVRRFQTDGQGRVTETAGLMPQLGSGPNSNNQGTGFYTKAQFIDLLRYAADREISIIPALDMPAHARAAVVSMRRITMAFSTRVLLALTTSSAILLLMLYPCTSKLARHWISGTWVVMKPTTYLKVVGSRTAT